MKIGKDKGHTNIIIKVMKNKKKKSLFCFSLSCKVLNKLFQRRFVTSLSRELKICPPSSWWNPTAFCLGKLLKKNLKERERHNCEFAQQQRLFPEIMTQLLKIILKLVFQALLWMKSFFSQNTQINFKRMWANSLKQRTERFFPPTWKRASRGESVFTTPWLRRRRTGTDRPPNFCTKRGESLSLSEKPGTKYFPKRGSSKIKRIVFTHVFGSLTLNIWSLSQTLTAKKKKA